MAETVIAATLELDSSKATKSIKEIRSEISDATEQLKKLQAAFGATSEEATKAAERLKGLKDVVKEVSETTKEDKPGKAFDEFSESVKNVIGGVRALNDTLQLLGTGSEDVEKALKKVESGLEFAENIKKGIKGFTDLKDMAVDAFKTIRGAVMSTGIGALVAALGTIYFYWDDIKDAISSVTAEQKEALATTTEHSNKEKEKLASLDEQSNVLKLQGKSEKDILELKTRQIKKVIEAAKAQLAAQKQIDKEQIESAERNNIILTGILEFLSRPLLLITSTLDKALHFVGINSDLTKGLLAGIKSVAKLVFDPADVRKKAEESQKEAEKGIAALNNQTAGYQIQANNIKKQELDKEAAYQKELRGIQNEGKYAQIADAYKLAKEQLNDQYISQQKEIEQSDKSGAQKDKLLLAAKETYNAKDKKLDADHVKDTEEHEKAALERLKKMHEENAQEEAVNKHDQNDARIKADFAAQEAEIKNMQASEDIKTKLLEEAKIKRDRLLGQNDADAAKPGKDVIDEIANTKAGELKSPFQKEEDALKKWHNDKLKAVGENEAAITAINEEYERQRTLISERENETRLKQIESVLGQAASLFSKNTIAFKVLSIAQATINTFLGVSDALAARTFTIFDTVAKFVNVAAILSAGLANVKKIVAVQVPGAPGGSVPSVSSGAGAPLMPKPQAVNTQLPQDQINQIGNATVRAYVLEQDIDQDRSRTTRLNRAARLGG